MALLAGTLSAAIGCWAVAGYALGDLILAARGTAFTGNFASSGKTYLSLVLCDLILFMLVVLAFPGGLVDAWNRLRRARSRTARM